MVVVTRTPEYLEHHGIQGQKWGVRNGPPYPLDYEQHNASEKSKNPKGSLNNYENNNPKTSNNIRVKRSSSNSSNAPIRKSILDMKVSEINLSDKQKETIKKVLIGVGATAVVALAAYGVYKSGILSKKSIPDLIKKSAADPIVEIMDPVDEWLYSLKSSGKIGSAMVFTNEAEGAAYSLKHLFDKQEWIKLSEAEQLGIKNYTGSFYKDMNNLLRGMDGTFHSKDLVKGIIDDCTSGLEKMRLPEDTLCHRGVGSLNSLAKTLGLNTEDLYDSNILKGLVDNGFTYTDPAFFSSGASTADAWGGVKIHAFAPKGTKGMYVDPISAVKGEHEVLLQRNTTFKIVDFQLGATGAVTDLFVEVVEQIL